MVEQNSRQVEQRDEEIRRIVESIAELQSIFKDLAGLVADQVPSDPLSLPSNHLLT